jgi:guanylate kinase
VKLRLRAASAEVRHYGEYDYVVVNDELDGCVRALRAVVVAARVRSSRMADAACRIVKTFPTDKEN